MSPAGRTEGHAASAEADVPARSGPASLEGATPESAAALRSVGFTVSTVGYAVSRAFHRSLAPLDLEPREFALLRAVDAHEGQSQQAIGHSLQIPSSRMVALVDALEARDLIERRLNPADRRARALHLTADGRALMKRAGALAVEYERHLCGDLSDNEREQLIALLQRVGAQLGIPADGHAAHSALADI